MCNLKEDYNPTSSICINTRPSCLELQASENIFMCSCLGLCHWLGTISLGHLEMMEKLNTFKERLKKSLAQNF